MDAISTAAGTAPGAAAVEGTIIYCTSAGADGVHENLGNTNSSAVVVTLSDACADATHGTLTLTVANATAGTSASTAAITEEQLVNALDGAAANVSIQDDIDGLANVDAATTTVAATSGDTCTFTITFPNTTGLWTVTAASTLSAHATNADGSCAATVATATPGVPATTLDFVDDDLATNTMMTVKTTAGATAAGAAGATRTYYQTWVYDSGDVFSLDAGGDEVATTVTGATEAAFETEAASFAALTNDVTISYRTGATTSGISYFILGT
jgi:hypothetical protein